ncbi:MAG: trypsin-like serine protease [Gemmatimonadetes bacterium]|nr:trypsin-like serine protease [Gemmatimonadota bacterium]
MARAIFLLLFCFVAGIAATVGFLFVRSASVDVAEPEPVIGSTVIENSRALDDSRGSAIVEAAKRVSPSVVTVSVLKTRVVRQGPPQNQSELFNRFLRDFFPSQQRRTEAPSMGSGLIINADGYIVTNGHVVDGAEFIEVVLSDGRRYDAEFVGRDLTSDISVIRINGEDLPVAELGDSDDLQIGEWAIAIGNPYGYLLNNTQPSVTAGVISALKRDIHLEGTASGSNYRDMIQTDAAINPGNSGGPLVNSNGEVVGINTFIFTQSGGSLGIGFATPINHTKRVVEEVIQYGHVRQVWVGLRVVDVTARIQNMLDLPSTDGVIISFIDAGSPAEESGIEMGDVILTIDGATITGIEQAQRALHGVQVGDRLRFGVLRDGQIKEFELRTKEMATRRRGSARQTGTPQDG